MQQTFLIPDQSLVRELRGAQLVVDDRSDQEAKRFTIVVPDDWNGVTLQLSSGRVVVVTGEHLVCAWEMDQSFAHLFVVLGWVTLVPFFGEEHPRYILNPPFIPREDGSIALSHALGIVLVPQEGRLVEEQEGQLGGKITDPVERQKILAEVGTMVQLWLSLDSRPTGPEYDASALVEKIVRGYEFLGDYVSADIYREMIGLEQTHDWEGEDDVC